MNLKECSKCKYSLLTFNLEGEMVPFCDHLEGQKESLKIITCPMVKK